MNAPLRLALLGYGQMGRLLEQLAPQHNCAVTLKLDEFNNANFEGITAGNFRGVDVAVDFSIPGAAVENIERVSGLGVNMVIGTTGWNDRLGHVREVIAHSGTGLVWSPNFSIGVNVFARLVSEAARLLANQSTYEAWAYEIHHSAKKDAPSGTLIKLMGDMKKAGYSARIDSSSNRAGAHSGTHEIGFDSAADTITLRHTARNKDGFAHGALEAAKWVVGKKGCFEFSEVAF